MTVKSIDTNTKHQMTLEVNTYIIENIIKTVITEEVVRELAQHVIKESKKVRYDNWANVEGCSELTSAIINSARERLLGEHTRRMSEAFENKVAQELVKRITDEELKNLLINVLLAVKK